MLCMNNSWGHKIVLNFMIVPFIFPRNLNLLIRTLFFFFGTYVKDHKTDWASLT